MKRIVDCWSIRGAFGAGRLRGLAGPLFCAVLGGGLIASGLLAQEPERPTIRRGQVKSVDADRGTITITAEGKDRDFNVRDATRIMDDAGKPAPGRLRNEGLKPGAPLMFGVAQRNGETVLVGLKLVGPGAGGGAGGNAAGAIRQMPPKVDMAGVTPLSEMARGETYHGVEGGLYPKGARERPADHERAGLELARQVVPLGHDGKPSPEGKVVLLTIGMSNTSQASSGFLRMTRGDAALSSRLVIVNGALGGMTADKIQHLDGGRSFPNSPGVVRYWDFVDQALEKAGVTRAQVQAVWLKEADAGPTQGWPAYARTLQSELVKIVQLMHDRFPALKLVYVSNRTYGGRATTRLNPEPYAYECGFAVKWLIAQQIEGDPALNFDPKRGPVKAPWLSWGPDLWANGSTERSDGYNWEPGDSRSDDGTHESEAGQDKVGRLLARFFKTDPTTRGWFTRTAAQP